MSKNSRTSSLLLQIQELLSTQLERLRLTEHTFMVIIAVIIGVLGGFGAIFFRFTIQLFEDIFFGQGNYTLDYIIALPWYVKLSAPALGGLIIGPIVYRFAREAKGHGVPEVMESIALRGGAIRPRVMIAKITASAICIGSGGSVGREGPIVQIGSAIGSILGQILKVTGSRLRTLVACGTAAGIAGTFNAPIAGALFAMEIILSDFAISQFSPIVVSSVAATVVSRHFLGDFPAFIIPPYELVSVYEMIPYALLGVLSAFTALAFIKIIYKVEDIFELIKFPGPLKPVLGGLIIGGIGIFFPHIFGVGYTTISLALENQATWYFLLFLIGLKLIATSVTIGSGGSGGIFAPSLFLGATLGGFVGIVVDAIFQGHAGSPGAYALVGMGAVAAGAMHAPITSIMIMFELTNDYRIILPLMLACIISVLITTRLKKDSIYTLKLSRRGIDLFQGQEVNVLRNLRVKKVMKSKFESVLGDTHFKKLMDLTVNSPHSNFFVVDQNRRLMGSISIHDVRKSFYETESLESIIVALDLMTPVKELFTKESTLDVVLNAFSESNIEELPIVNSIEDKILIGVVAKNDVIDAYNKEIFKRDMVTSVSSYLTSVNKYKSVDITNGNVLSEFEVPGKFIGKTLKSLELRTNYNVQIVLIKQNFDSEKNEWGNVLTPSPNYTFKFGDTVLVMGAKEDLNKITKSG